MVRAQTSIVLPLMLAVAASGVTTRIVPGGGTLAAFGLGAAVFTTRRRVMR